MSKFQLSKTGEKFKKRKNKKTRSKSVFLNFIILIIACAVGIFYFIQTNFIAAEGYKIDDLKSQIAEFDAKNRQLEVRALEFQSMFNIEDKIAELNMIDGSNVAHIDSAGFTVAVR